MISKKIEQQIVNALLIAGHKDLVIEFLKENSQAPNETSNLATTATTKANKKAANKTNAKRPKPSASRENIISEFISKNPAATAKELTKHLQKWWSPSVAREVARKHFSA